MGNNISPSIIKEEFRATKLPIHSSNIINNNNSLCINIHHILECIYQRLRVRFKPKIPEAPELPSSLTLLDVFPDRTTCPSWSLTTKFWPAWPSGGSPRPMVPFSNLSELCVVLFFSFLLPATPSFRETTYLFLSCDHCVRGFTLEKQKNFGLSRCSML